MFIEICNLYQWNIGIFLREIHNDKEFSNGITSDLSDSVLLSFGFLLFSVNFIINK